MGMIQGVLNFEHYCATVRCCFPEGKARCTNCTFFNKYTGRCNLTQSMCFYPDERMNYDCPLAPIEEENK